MSVLVVVIFYESIFFITDLGIGSRLVSDISLILMLPIILLGTKRVVNSFGTKMKRYCWLVIIFIFVVLLSIIGSSWMIFGQPVSIGLVAARKSLFIVSLFLFDSLRP